MIDKTEDEDDARPARFEKIARYLIWTGLVAVVGSAFIYFAAFREHPVGETGDWGAFGDFVSGIAGTALAGATLVAVALTLSLQARELDASRRVLRDQARTLNKQTFEATFFQLLQRFTTISAPLHEKSTFDFFRTAVVRQFVDSHRPNRREDLLGAFQNAYAETYGDYEDSMAVYFRTLFHLIKVVEKASISPQDKADYISLIRAQLSTHELVVLFFNTAGSAEGRDGLRPLVEKYGMLKHMKHLTIGHNIDAFRDAAVHADAFRSREEREAARNN